MYVRGYDVKEYIYQSLFQPLQAGKIYCLSFFVSKADKVPYAIKSIGAFFSNSIPAITNGYQINATPQVVNTGGFISDTVQWVQIQGCFTANGGEQYVTIGNFTPNGMTDTLNVGTNDLIINGETESYYYIDDVQLWDALTTDIESSGGTKFSVYPNPGNDFLKFDFANEKTFRRVKLFNIYGDLILITDASKSQTTLNISDFEKGVYFYEIELEGRVLAKNRIVIN